METKTQTLQSDREIYTMSEGISRLIRNTGGTRAPVGVCARVLAVHLRVSVWEVSSSLLQPVFSAHMGNAAFVRMRALPVRVCFRVLRRGMWVE